MSPNLSFTEIKPGLRLYDCLITADEQQVLVEDLRAIAVAAPLIAPMTPWGKPMSVRMSSAGRVGWLTGKSGYRYSTEQTDGEAWPDIPESILKIWREVSGWDGDPDCCLINFYSESARMGLHRDADEDAYDAPVVSISLGDPARFRIGGLERKSPTESFELNSGDVLVMGGEARLAYHGVDRIRFGVSPLLPKGGRINLTMRVVRSI
ncbi:MAG: alpha-ketoglutarate-dependent dioxygenase AlkB family protein [Pikeienuella sp.]